MRHRLVRLDALRGAASLSVVLWHWQHFFAIRTPDPAQWDMAARPFSAVLFPFYKQGFLGVDLFFLLSGFIFFWGQKSQIEHRELSGADFFWRRFSRLYPLYAVALVLTAGLQYAFHHIAGRFFVVRDMDAAHFLASAAMIQGWGGGETVFNGPAWSVSVEALLYLLFFSLAVSGALRRVWVALTVAVLGIGIAPIDPHLSRGLTCFFLGGVIHAVWLRMRGRHGFLTPLCVATAAGWLIALAHLRWGFLRPPLLDGLRRLPVLRAHADVAAHLILSETASLVLFPLTVLTFALLDAKRTARTNALSFLGDISYSSYLLHFPLQTAIAVFAVAYGGLDVAHSKMALILFFATLIPLSYGTFRWFERPAQAALRRRRKTASGPAPSLAPGYDAAI